MAILLRNNPEANPNNALQITRADGICCGDETPVIICDYAVTFATGTLTAITQIRIDGTTYVFSQSCATGTTAGRAALKVEIQAALKAAGYTQDGVLITVSGSDCTITLAASAAVFEWVQSNTYPFIKSNCQAYGDFKGGNCEFTVFSNRATTGDFVITPIGTDTITNILVNDGTTDLYDGPLVYGAGTDAANWSANGTILISITAAAYDNVTITFTVTATFATCDTLTATVVQVFPNI